MSGLDIIIDPEVNQNTQSYYVIQDYLKKVPVKTIIEIGASSGGGTTEALIKGTDGYYRVNYSLLDVEFKQI